MENSNLAGDEFEAFEDLRESLDTFVERWSKIQRNSVKSIQAVTNTLVQIEHLDGPLGKLESLQNIREATVEELAATSGMTSNLARKVKEAL